MERRTAPSPEELLNDPRVMDDVGLYRDLENCRLCAWECGADRLAGEAGVCGLTVPLVAHSSLHPAPPASYDAFMAGCNLRCLSCQNWRIANYPQSPAAEVEGYCPPKVWAKTGVGELRSPQARLMGADRLFFTGGEPTPSLPWVEAVVKEARSIDPAVKVNYDTNGFLTPDSLLRVLDFTTSITYDIKAVREETFSALTGGFVEPVLRNAEEIGRRAKDKLWEFRVLAIEGVHAEEEIQEVCEFVASIDPSLPVSFLAFRPNFVMESARGSSWRFMEGCVEMGAKAGLERVSWSGLPDVPRLPSAASELMDPSRLAVDAGCAMSVRVCGDCAVAHECPVKSYVARRST
jgi:pyruvate formate lyase activating enzyme